MNAAGFTPDKDTAIAYFTTVGAVPAGEAAWRYYEFRLKDTDGTVGKWVERVLTVAEL
jgi:hypothetical protein